MEIYGISQPYLLNIAVWEPRKNLELLVRTFINMKKNGWLPKHKLVLIGKKGWKSNRTVSLVSDSIGEHIIAPGYVPDQHLPALYVGADAFIFPSLYEGFGMPVLEARACGTRIVATDIPELREAGGKDPVYVEPTEEGIREGILEALKKAKPDPTQLIRRTWEQGGMTLAKALLGERLLTE
jgi:glycosyltransferase involved in cell wall biosynthesis